MPPPLLRGDRYNSKWNPQMVKLLNQKTGRALEIIIGLYLIIGALPKGFNINHFAVQMSAYQVIPDPNWLPPAALATLLLEMLLGMAMTLGLRFRGIVLALYQGMLLFFSGLIVYAWQVHGLEDCGCFPLLKMTPQVSLMKNLLLFLAGCLLAWIFRPWGSGFSCGIPRKKLLLRLAFMLAVSLGLTGYAMTQVERIPTSVSVSDLQNTTTAKGPYADFIVPAPEGERNLGQGTHLVAMLSMTCEECMAKVPELNALSMVPGMPPLSALCYEERPGAMKDFVAMTGPIFPLLSLGDKPLIYYTLRGQDPFRLSLIQNGFPLRHWDGEIPAPEEIFSVLAETEADAGR